MGATIKNNQGRAHGFFIGTKEDAANGGNGKNWTIYPTEQKAVDDDLLARLQTIPQFREAVSRNHLSVFKPVEQLPLELEPEEKTEPEEPTIPEIVTDELLDDTDPGKFDEIMTESEVIDGPIDEQPQPEPEPEDPTATDEEPDTKQPRPNRKRGRGRK